MGKQILVYCWAGHSNIGDELFKDAFWKLFPDHSFRFTDTIAEAHKGFDALFIGGGSFLEFPISGIDEEGFQVRHHRLLHRCGWFGHSSSSPSTNEACQAHIAAFGSQLRVHQVAQSKHHSRLRSRVFSLRSGFRAEQDAIVRQEGSIPPEHQLRPQIR